MVNNLFKFSVCIGLFYVVLVVFEGNKSFDSLWALFCSSISKKMSTHI